MQVQTISAHSTCTTCSLFPHISTQTQHITPVPCLLPCDHILHTTPKNQDVGIGLRKIVVCSQLYFAVSSCIYSFWRDSFIFTLVSLIFTYNSHRHLHNTMGCLALFHALSSTDGALLLYTWICPDISIARTHRNYACANPLVLSTIGQEATTFYKQWWLL